MNNAWLQNTTLRIASWLAPGDQRAEWMEEWRSELWYIRPPGATRFCFGAFRDAFWLRRNNTVPAQRNGMPLESPFTCLALLATLASVSLLILAGPLASRLESGSANTARDLPGICMVMVLFSCLFLPGTLWVWRRPASRHALPWTSKLRRGIFLALKIALLQPIFVCGMFLQILLGQLGGFTGLVWDAAIILALRWVITDQQRRCPVCLRLLGNPVRIGTPSQTFLEWYGTESTCSRGHGLLHVSEMSSGYSRKPQWLNLDDSWSSLFVKSARRQL